MKLYTVIIGVLIGVCVQKPASRDIKDPSVMGDWKTLENNDYSIQYPNDWELQQNGQAGTKFILLSKLVTPQDQFRENVNLLIQDLTGQNINLDKYTAISEGQIKTMIKNGTILESKRIRTNGKEYQKEVYTGDQAMYKLKFEQYYWVIGTKAYVLTFTAELSNFDSYKTDGEKILNSFVIK